MWSLPALLVWELLQPLLGPAVDALVAALVAASGRQVDVTRLNRDAVLFIALTMAHRPAWSRAARDLPAGVLACVASEAAAIVALAWFPHHEGLMARFVRSLTVGLDRAMPVLAWLYLARDRVFAAHSFRQR